MFQTSRHLGLASGEEWLSTINCQLWKCDAC